MKGYVAALKVHLMSWKALPVLLFTVGRIFYGYRWIKSGWGKLPWLTDGEVNSVGFITRMIENMRTDRGDPFRIGRIFAEIADNIFLNLPNLTDALVVIFEILIGLMLIVGLKLFWTMLVALFLNLQFFAAGSTNNFGYVITNLIIIQWVKYFDVIGIEGFIRYKKQKNLL